MKYDIVKIKITNRCNRRCSFCVFNEKSNLSTDLSFDDFKFIVNRIKELDFDKIHINGGEPTIHRDFIKMIEYVKTEIPNKIMVLGTNCIEMSKDLELLEFVKRNFDEVCIGCDDEHRNIEQVKFCIEELKKGINKVVVINSLRNYLSPEVEEQIKKVSKKYGCIYVENDEYHNRKGKPVNKLNGLCNQNGKRVLMIQENGNCYRCFNCCVPEDCEFNIFDDNFFECVNVQRKKHYKFCGWCTNYDN